MSNITHGKTEKKTNANGKQPAVIETIMGKPQ